MATVQVLFSLYEAFWEVRTFQRSSLLLNATVPKPYTARKVSRRITWQSLSARRCCAHAFVRGLRALSAPRRYRKTLYWSFPQARGVHTTSRLVNNNGPLKPRMPTFLPLCRHFPN